MTVEECIRSDIEARIHSGVWRPGDRIPFEHELVATYGCARATVSKALTTLARTGLIERRRKAGSFVAHPQVHSAVLAVPDFAQMITARGEQYGWTLLIRRIAREKDFLETSGIPSSALLIKGIHRADNLPFCLERRLISLSAVPDAADELYADVSPGSWLIKRVPWTRARHAIRAIAATRSEAKQLGMRVGGACLCIDRWTWRVNDPITHVRQLFPGDRYDLVAEFRPGAA